jgi:hypothetical protein
VKEWGLLWRRGASSDRQRIKPGSIAVTNRVPNQGIKIQEKISKPF